MVIEVREPKEGELWYRRDAIEGYGIKYDGLYLYTRVGCSGPYMLRCYGLAEDLRHASVVEQFASLNFGSPVKVEPYQLVRGDWFLAAEPENTAKFLKEQIETYRRLMVADIERAVLEMQKIVQAGRNDIDMSAPWIL